MVRAGQIDEIDCGVSLFACLGQVGAERDDRQHPAPGRLQRAVVADRGARVVSFDRSPLRDDLMASELVEFVKGDAFRYTPDAPVDWLLCDVAAVPERAIEMLDAWLTEKHCRRFCVTLKLKGDDPFSPVDAARTMLARHAVRATVRQLGANKNELTVYGSALQGA